jgi:hypothetical protein
MSWEAINKILTQATIDTHFAHRLLAAPLQTALEAGYELTAEEQSAFSQAQAKDISEFSQFLLFKLGREQS